MPIVLNPSFDSLYSINNDYRAVIAQFTWFIYKKNFKLIDFKIFMLKNNKRFLPKLIKYKKYSEKGGYLIPFENVKKRIVLAIIVL